MVSQLGIKSMLMVLCMFAMGQGLVTENDDKKSGISYNGGTESILPTFEDMIIESNDNGSDSGNSSCLSDTDLPQVVEAGRKTAAQQEKLGSSTIFFILLVLAFCILVTHLLITTKFHYLPESVAVVIVGGIIGAVVKLLSAHNLANWQEEEAFPPTIFFLIILPPIIFESGYNLHKGNFFANFGSILIFAILGTLVSACIIGGGIYLLGLADVAYKLTLIESFAFGSLISAVDPVATLAIFHAMDVEPLLYMLVFGESMLNDAVSIVLTSTALGMASPKMQAMSGAQAALQGVGNFCLMFFASSGIGILFALLSAVILKFVDLRRTPSLEVGLMLVFSYLPYGLAEGLDLSGIMAILFTGIVMSHYTHRNLSPVSQITIQQVLRTVAFMSETCVFAYLGLSIFSMHHHVRISFVVWSIVLCLIGRAANIFPLSILVNRFRIHKITPRMQFIMWFSGLRGAVAFALSLHIDLEREKRQVLVTTTLIIVLFTVLVLGGSALPLVTLLDRKKNRRRKREVTLSKTKEMGETIETDYLSQSEVTEDEIHFRKAHVNRFMKLDEKYFTPWFTRRVTAQEVSEGQSQMASLADLWYKETTQRSSPSETEADSVSVTADAAGGGAVDSAIRAPRSDVKSYL